tara:strand:- start:1186 stop:1359 length:174 start_codon:yes stop_codon:yes gene_type:complete
MLLTCVSYAKGTAKFGPHSTQYFGDCGSEHADVGGGIKKEINAINEISAIKDSPLLS